MVLLLGFERCLAVDLGVRCISCEIGVGAKVGHERAAEGVTGVAAGGNVSVDVVDLDRLHVGGGRLYVRKASIYAGSLVRRLRAEHASAAC